MHHQRKYSFLFFILLALVIFWSYLLRPINIAIATTVSSSVYEQRQLHNPDGIGKYYMGREIAKVMGHTGAAWLERPSRETEEKPSKILDALHLKSTDVVADIGAGTGYLSFRIAPKVPQGKVLAVDIQPEMLDIINFFKQELNVTNVEAVLATPTNPNLPPASVDLALMVDAYHEFEYPREVMQAIVKALKPDGRVVLVEYRGENPLIMIKGLHKMTQKQVKKEMQAVGLVWRETKNLLPQQHLMVFAKG
ncbi:class I SAM-dependent methyltransferase [Fischerella thermalis]|uniref:Methyltransferase type 11 n=1 Tax=Fischerella thermalis JSC-11 TaxID=741277 RepID=G6FQT7_9CYAN|nr:class I SAM-dependent methyltransferase [Fischerella thermalis]PLZ84182.1 SAM-dependent methyltransferase [Fischerella thermalis WC217]PMB07093.1 class I SAM-dependent methyltransferase [Fischerella thermalis CCMEE 5328]EHC18172.1 Methyltransferase type 11 [Fischerella thermalis JSC-11]MBF1991054.1 class I SAM-dependent methyltransferase [Fischerella thermalis M58_A2018_009]MBF2062775.1 class I SAM-dependent methyltransferase [Fischerella thermalis M66_A2018_004]